MSLLPDSAMAAKLRRTLSDCVPELQRLCADPWIVIGSAAAWLVGAPVEVADLDILTSTRDAGALMGQWHEHLLATGSSVGSEQFRSHFGRFGFSLPVEVMGDLEVATPEGWQPVRIGAIQVIRIDGLHVPVPTIDEQVRWLERFGRPKDELRAGLLKSLAGTPA